MKKKGGYNDMLSEAQKIIDEYPVKLYKRHCRRKRAKISLVLCLLFLCLGVFILAKFN